MWGGDNINHHFVDIIIGYYHILSLVIIQFSVSNGSVDAHYWLIRFCGYQNWVCWMALQSHSLCSVKTTPTHQPRSISINFSQLRSTPMDLIKFLSTFHLCLSDWYLIESDEIWLDQMISDKVRWDHMISDEIETDQMRLNEIRWDQMRSDEIGSDVIRYWSFEIRLD